MIENITGKMIAFSGFFISFLSAIATFFGYKITSEDIFISIALVISGIIIIKIEGILDELKKLNEYNDKISDSIQAEKLY